MEIKKNQSVYYIPYVRLKQDTYGAGVGTLVEGSEYPIKLNNIAFDLKGKIPIMVLTKHACNIVHLKDEEVETFVKRVEPKFKLGQVVKNVKSGGHFRIWEVDIISGRIWYRNGWSIATGYENGVGEENLIAADDSEQWHVEYNDKLVEQKKPDYYKFVMNRKVA